MAAWFPLPEQWRALAAASPGALLLETLRSGPADDRSFLFTEAVRAIEVREAAQLNVAFEEIEAALAKGLYAAGYFAYECGFAFQAGKLSADPRETEAKELPLAWLGIFRAPAVFHHLTGEVEGNVPALVSVDAGERTPVPQDEPRRVTLGLSEESYAGKIAAIQELIRAGDTYQVNFTDSVQFDTKLPPAALYDELAERQPVPYAAWLNLHDVQILSFSPELFFRVVGRRIVTKPMKGTARRGLDRAEDEIVAAALGLDEKNRSEHVMIVDLLRNDLGRVCEVGSVQADPLFAVETYETLLQMTSTVSGSLRQEVTYADVFRSLFPSGSITGAPKRRTMEIIDGLERGPRGVYTGAIGYFAPRGEAAFNVPIRTLVLRDGVARMGVGGGIVADSKAEDEWRECLLKAAFLERPRVRFELFETMLWDGGCPFLGMHLDRLEDSAAYFFFAFERGRVEEELALTVSALRAGAPFRLRLLLERGGAVRVDVVEHAPAAPSGRVCMAAERTSSADVFLRHKTTHRAVYNSCHAEAVRDGFDDALFLNERGEVTEGAINNVFVERGGELLTPPLMCGALPGVYRRHVLETHPRAREQVLRLDDLLRADAVYVSNALRGLRRVQVELR